MTDIAQTALRSPTTDSRETGFKMYILVMRTKHKV